MFLLIFSTTVFAYPSAKIYEFTFNNSSQNWLGDFADYPRDSEEFYELSWGWENVPDGHSPYKKAIFLAGNNHSDDLFMYVKTPISGLKSHTNYALTFSIDLLSSVPVGQMGIGGAEGEAVYVKVGAANIEPLKILSGGQYLLNVNKGDQMSSGVNGVTIGNLANPLVDPNHRTYETLSLSNSQNPLFIKSNDEGQIWIFVGTDSGFEGITKYYIAKVKVNIQEK
jgi:hypothetical protein